MSVKKYKHGGERRRTWHVVEARVIDVVWKPRHITMEIMARWCCFHARVRN